ncbi:hypothetical protein EYF80_041385 [Liparis tanakae]|uniref:Uncharacterized protein n=1 Tax=Liparis tanakae TaxID=230148 RepID=A0A4Z2G4E6_9TELE|nr:hypothetical protein EYF80_041385 [Liparis tanakae]
MVPSLLAAAAASLCALLLRAPGHRSGPRLAAVKQTVGGNESPGLDPHLGRMHSTSQSTAFRQHAAESYTDPDATLNSIFNDNNGLQDPEARGEDQVNWEDHLCSIGHEEARLGHANHLALQSAPTLGEREPTGPSLKLLTSVLMQTAPGSIGPAPVTVTGGRRTVVVFGVLVPAFLTVLVPVLMPAFLTAFLVATGVGGDFKTPNLGFCLGSKGTRNEPSGLTSRLRSVLRNSAGRRLDQNHQTLHTATAHDRLFSSKDDPVGTEPPQTFTTASDRGARASTNGCPGLQTTF